MRRTIWYRPVNCGDGSYMVEFFDSKEAIELLGEHDPEAYSDGDGCTPFSFDLVLDGIHPSYDIEGISITTLEEVKNRLGLS